VVIVGYYTASRGTTRYTGCRPSLARIDARAEAFAARNTWAYFVDGEDVVTTDMIASDRVHPSAQGSAAIAGLVAGVIADVE